MKKYRAILHGEEILTRVLKNVYDYENSIIIIKIFTKTTEKLYRKKLKSFVIQPPKLLLNI